MVKSAEFLSFIPSSSLGNNSDLKCLVRKKPPGLKLNINFLQNRAPIIICQILSDQLLTR